jgi:hypothetical protein
MVEAKVRHTPHPDNIIPVLYKYYLYMRYARLECEKCMRDPSAQPNMGMEFLVSVAGITMSFWYGMLCVVLEGGRQTGLSDSEIDSLLQSPHVEMLREFRHGVFHFQRTWLPKKQEAFFASRSAVEWVRNLSDAFGRCLLSEMQRINAASR